MTAEINISAKTF